MKIIAVFVALCVLASCTSMPPKMTMEQRKEVSTVMVSMNSSEAVATLTQFFMSVGYSIDGYDENTHILSTGWSSEDIGALASSMVGKMEQRVQVAIHDRAESCELEFFIYDRFGKEDEGLNLYPARYEDLVERFRLHLE